jgi:hypothetical protein
MKNKFLDSVAKLREELEAVRKGSDCIGEGISNAVLKRIVAGSSEEAPWGNFSWSRSIWRR